MGILSIKPEGVATRATDLFGTVPRWDTLRAVFIGTTVHMGLIRFLILLALAYVAYLLWRRFKAARAESRRHDAPEPERMVRCAQCQLHLPENLAQIGRASCRERVEIAEVDGALT